MMRWWWLSFADPDLPAGSQFLGVSIVSIQDGGDIADAALEAYNRDCNPGGECLGGPLPGEPAAKWRNRLLSKVEAKALGDLAWPWPESLQ